MPRARKRTSVTAEELLRELEGEPDYVRQQAARKRETEREIAALRRAESPLTEELRQVGLDLDSAWDLVNTAAPYPAALPILLDHLERDYPDRVREGIARALAVTNAGFAWERLVRLYGREPAGTDAKDGMAVALAAIADEDDVAQLTELARDSHHGESRILLLRKIAQLHGRQASDVLEELGRDPQLAEEARRLQPRHK